MAEVTAIEECPPIAGGCGSVVIAAVVTSNARELVRAVFADGEELVGTDLHPVWNFKRQDWTPLGKLVPGDYVLADGIPLAVRSVTRLTADEAVYNLEIHGHHVYEAGASGVLVHNTDEACEAYKRELKELLDAGNSRGALELAQKRRAVLKLSEAESAQLDEIKRFLDGQTTGAKTGPKPKGTGPHNLTIERRINELQLQLGPDWEHVGGGSLTEHYIRTPDSLTHQARRPDITFRNKKTGEYYHENVGKIEASGIPVKRERGALDDLETRLGKRPGFTGYGR